MSEHCAFLPELCGHEPRDGHGGTAVVHQLSEQGAEEEQREEPREKVAGRIHERSRPVREQRLARGEAPVEKIEDEKVLVWPDLVYTELIAMIVVTFLLVIWAVLLKAPLEEPASSAKAPSGFPGGAIAIDPRSR